MNIIISDFVEGARNARGIAVIIDVFRAFSVACYAFDCGVKSVLPVGAVEDARALKLAHPDYLLVGERFGSKLEGFDFGNSPTEITQAPATRLKQATIIHTTHAGTQGLVNAKQADEVITGGLVNAQAIANYIKQQSPDEVHLVRMGLNAEENTGEDDICAAYLHALLTDNKKALANELRPQSIYDTLHASPCAQRFLDPAVTHSPLSDFELCLEINRFNFVVRAEMTNGLLQLHTA